MTQDQPPPAGPRGAIGAAAEDVAAGYLRDLGWSVLARNMRVGRTEIDIVGLEPGPPLAIVLVEVRSHGGPRFGSPLESVDGLKVARLYGAALTLRVRGFAAERVSSASATWRVDLLTLKADGGSGWAVEAHLRGLEPP